MTAVLAVDIGGTNTKIALVNSGGEVGEIISAPTYGDKGVEPFLNSIAQGAQRLISEYQVELAGMGIGVAGFVDSNHTMMTFNPNIAWLENAPLAEFFSNRLDLPVYLEIDSNAAALAEEAHGNGKGIHRLLVLTIGTGLGGGMTINGEILRVANECLGDVGHVIVEPGGTQCAAGCKGCAEALVSALALERYAAEIGGTHLHSGDKKPENGKIHTTYEIIRAAHAGDEVSIQAIQKLGKYLGIALASMAPIFAPEKICIAGGVSEAGEILLEPALSSFHEISGPPYAEGVVIEKALLGWQSVMVGAAEAFRRYRK
jgi:glucokinase